jgi:hypothetical protein
VLILLPPSEGKAEPRRGRPVDLGAGPIADARRDVCDALVDLCRGPEDEAIRALGLSEAQTDDVRRNARLPQLPSAPAERVYRGVLYETLGLTTLDASAHTGVPSRGWRSCRRCTAWCVPASGSRRTG